MIKQQAFILVFALLVLCYTAATLSGSDDRPEGYYLTVGEKGVAEITYTVPGSSGGCVHADGSLFRKGETVWLEGVDRAGLRAGIEVTALDKHGMVIWSATLGGSHYEFVWNDWNVFYEEG